MARGVAHEPEVKAAVMAALLMGQSVESVAAEYKLPVGTVKAWAWREQPRDLAAVTDEHREEIGELLMRFVRTALRSATAREEHFGDKDWLNKQDASSVAVLHGVSIDKVIRLLEAIAGDESSGSSPANVP